MRIPSIAHRRRGSLGCCAHRGLLHLRTPRWRGEPRDQSMPKAAGGEADTTDAWPFASLSWICIYTYVDVYIYLSINMCIYIYMCMCVYRYWLIDETHGWKEDKYILNLARFCRREHSGDFLGECVDRRSLRAFEHRRSDVFLFWHAQWPTMIYPLTS